MRERERNSRTTQRQKQRGASRLHGLADTNAESSRPSSSTSPKVADSIIPQEKRANFTLAPTILLIGRDARLSELVLINPPQQGLALCLSANPPS